MNGFITTERGWFMSFGCLFMSSDGDFDEIFHQNTVNMNYQRSIVTAVCIKINIKLQNFVELFQ